MEKTKINYDDKERSEKVEDKHTQMRASKRDFEEIDAWKTDLIGETVEERYKYNKEEDERARADEQTINERSIKRGFEEIEV
jgi:type II restriction/modification system DNA methylase subunit YeeA